MARNCYNYWTKLLVAAVASSYFLLSVAQVPCFAEDSNSAGVDRPIYKEKRIPSDMELYCKYLECADRRIDTDGINKFVPSLTRRPLSSESRILKLKADSSFWMTRTELKDFFSREVEKDFEKDFLWFDVKYSITDEQTKSLLVFAESLGYRELFVRNAYNGGVCVLLTRVDSTPQELQERQLRLKRDMRSAGALLGANKAEVDRQLLHLHHKSTPSYDYLAFQSQRDAGSRILFKCADNYVYSVKYLPLSYSLWCDKSYGDVVTLWAENDTDGNDCPSFRGPCPWIGAMPAKMTIASEDTQLAMVYACVDDLGNLSLEQVEQKFGKSITLIDRESGDKYLFYYLGKKKFNILLPEDVFVADVVAFQESKGKIVSIEMARLLSAHAF